MSLLRQGFGEVARKFRRLGLRRRLRRASRARAAAARTLGRRAYETGSTGAAADDVMGRLAASNAQGQELAAQLEALEESRKQWEAYRDAEAARLQALEQGVLERRAPLDARLAEQRQAVALGRQHVEEVRRRLLQGAQERQSLESALAGPPSDPSAAVDPAQARARIAALETERQQLEAWQVQRAAADAAIAAEIDGLQRELAPLTAELERIRAERKSTGDAAKKALDELRRQSGGVRKQVEGVSLAREGHFEELGGALAAAGVAAPALAAELEAWRQADAAHGALQASYDRSLAESRSLPRGTMAKFSGVTAAALLALCGGAFAAVQLAQSILPAPVEEDEDCRQDYDVERPPVVADPGGPYEVVRGGVAPLDGSRSKGRCLTYTWTFGPDPSPPKPPPDKHRPGTGIFAENEESVAATARVVAENSCPEGTRGNPDAEKTGRTAPTTFLCTLEVTLTVNDGRTPSSASVVVKVKPRAPKWKTAVKTDQAVRYEPDTKLIRTPAGGLPVDLHLGTNVCALDDSPEHAYHADRPWAGVGYEVATVSDPDGPFDEWTYVGKPSLSLQRAALLNQDLDPGSKVYQRNLAAGYRDIQTLREAVIAHERLHGELMFEMFRRVAGEDRDPAAALEALSTAPEDDSDPGEGQGAAGSGRRFGEEGLTYVADMAIGQIESHLLPEKDSDHYIALHLEIKRRLARQFGRAGKILLPDGSGEDGEFKIRPSFAQTGENGGG